ncbi:MAG: ABC transporter transmembrane domain-containing protein, partial [Nereida ignava]
MARSTESSAEDRGKSKQISALRGLSPFVKPYRMQVVLTLLALTATAALSLILPLAVRRVVDGFGAGDVALLDKYFGAAIAVAGLLAVGTGLRYFLVTRLGERIVADMRKAVFSRVISLS